MIADISTGNFVLSLVPGAEAGDEATSFWARAIITSSQVTGTVVQGCAIATMCLGLLPHCRAV